MLLGSLLNWVWNMGHPMTGWLGLCRGAQALAAGPVGQLGLCCELLGAVQGCMGAHADRAGVGEVASVFMLFELPAMLGAGN